MKEITELSWNVDESTYRKGAEISYSNISDYEKYGFEILEHMGEKKTSPSLVFGSAVDCILTDGMADFARRFKVMELPKLSDKLENVIYSVFEYVESRKGDNPFPPFSAISDDTLSRIGEECDYWKGASYKNKRVNEIKKGAPLYDALVKSYGYTLLSKEEYEDAVKCSNALRTSPATCNIFAENTPGSHIKRYYQLKFRTKIEGIGLRCMFDVIMVDYDKKIVYPIDLKTTLAVRAYQFPDNFIKWHYQIQARLYWRILRQLMDADDEFRDYKLEMFQFAFINKNEQLPMLYRYEDSDKIGTLKYKRATFRDPLAMAKELDFYLKKQPKAPIGMSILKPNSLTKLLGIYESDSQNKEERSESSDSAV